MRFPGQRRGLRARRLELSASKFGKQAPDCSSQPNDKLRIQCWLDRRILQRAVKLQRQRGSRDGWQYGSDWPAHVNGWMELFCKQSDSRGRGAYDREQHEQCDVHQFWYDFCGNQLDKQRQRYFQLFCAIAAALQFERQRGRRIDEE